MNRKLLKRSLFSCINLMTISIQVSACLFLGACFIALTDPVVPEGASAGESMQLTRNSFLIMVDTRVGLNRFLEVLKRPLAAR